MVLRHSIKPFLLWRKVKMLAMSKAIWVFLCLGMVCIFAGDLENHIQEAELHIDRTYKTVLSREVAIRKLKSIVFDESLSENDKIAAIRKTFLQQSLETITPNNAHKLLFVRPLTWKIHSILNP
jgi:hypothetical protein